MSGVDESAGGRACVRAEAAAAVVAAAADHRYY